MIRKMALAVGEALLAAERPYRAETLEGPLRTASVTGMDSPENSIACIAGSFAGACHGVAAWPADGVANIEYRDRLETIAQQIALL